MKEIMSYYCVFLERVRLIKVIKIPLLLLIFSLSYNVKADITFNPTFSYDISAIPGGIEFPVIQTRLPYNIYGVIGCLSESDDKNGACNVSSRTSPDLGKSPPLENWASIKIVLTEIQNNHAINSVIHTSIRGYRSNDCDSRYPWASITCVKSQQPVQLHLGIDNTVLSNIPKGVWEGHLIMNQRQAYLPLAVGEKILVNFRLEVTDNSKKMIYFPAFPASDPHVDLNLNYRPGSGKNGGVSGSSNLDMCLYDGGTSAKTVQLLFQDESVSVLGKEPDLFSIYRDGADKNKSGNRIDYKLQVINPTTGGHDTIMNGKTITWQNANARGIQRNVVLPGVPGVSLCLPAPLTFITPAFNYSEKSSGHYTGVLRVVYTISTTLK